MCMNDESLYPAASFVTQEYFGNINITAELGLKLIESVLTFNNINFNTPVTIT